MNNLLKVAMTTVVLAFVLTNLYLLYSKDSVIPKMLYVEDYKRVQENNYKQEVFKETLVAPTEAHTIYVGNEEAVEAWLVKEGDEVYIGQELATLSTARIDNERNVWETERSGLIDQKITLESKRSELDSAHRDANSYTTSDSKNSQQVTEVEQKTMIELGINVGFTMDITLEGAYAQAIAAIDQQLADIERQLTVLDAQLAQDDATPSLISPVNGVVSNVIRHGERLAIDIYDEEQIAVTFVDEKEWQQFEEGQHVKIQGDGLTEVIEGDILSVSSVPTKESEQLTAYQKLKGTDKENQLAYYEVRMLPGESLNDVPYTSNLKSMITVDEAYGATAIPNGWGRIDEEDQIRVIQMKEDGRPALIRVTTPFTVNEQVVITDGLMSGDIVIHEPALYHFEYAPQLYMSFPSYKPTKEEWKGYGWRNYLKAMLLK